MRAFYLKNAHAKAKEAVDFEAQRAMYKDVQAEKDALADLVAERKKLAAAIEVKKAWLSNKLVAASRTEAGDSFLQDLAENEDSDNEVTNTELVEVSLFYREAKTMSVAVEMLCLSRVTITKIILTITKFSNV